MSRNRVSENKNGAIGADIAFCSKTGERIEKVSYDTRDLIRKSQCKNTWAQGVVKALFENEPNHSKDLKNTAESVLFKLHERANEVEKTDDSLVANLPKNFSELEKRTNAIKIRKVKKVKKDQKIDQNLRSVIESIIDEKIAQV